MKSVTIDSKRLRLAAGICGIILPWLMVIISTSWCQSISINYYNYFSTGTFMSVMGFCCGVLISYKGYSKIDDIISTLSGLFGLGICIFPMESMDALGSNIDVGVFHLSSNISNIFHIICAFCFFGLLAYNSLFLFTKSSGELTKKKKIRNIIFRVCGVFMIGSFALMLLNLIPGLEINNLTWIVETLALTAFGTSWCTKANCLKILFCD